MPFVIIEKPRDEETSEALSEVKTMCCGASFYQHRDADGAVIYRCSACEKPIMMTMGDE